MRTAGEINVTTTHRRNAFSVWDRECWNCGLSEKDGERTNIEVHHLRPGGGDEIDNLVPLCTQCHRMIHNSNETLDGDLGMLQWVLWSHGILYPDPSVNADAIYQNGDLDFQVGEANENEPD